MWRSWADRSGSTPRADLRGKVAVVMQKAQLFGGTIRSNLLWGSQNASDATSGPHWKRHRLRSS